MRSGPREKLLYTVTVQPNLDEPHGDYLSTVDVDPESPTYCQVNKSGIYTIRSFILRDKQYYVLNN